MNELLNHISYLGETSQILQDGAQSIIDSLKWAGDALKVWAGALGAIGIIVYFFSATRD
jgi:hypothetical protein